MINLLAQIILIDTNLCERLPELHYSVIYIFLSFVLIVPILEFSRARVWNLGYLYEEFFIFSFLY